MEENPVIECSDSEMVIKLMEMVKNSTFQDKII